MRSPPMQVKAAGCSQRENADRLRPRASLNGHSASNWSINEASNGHAGSNGAANGHDMLVPEVLAGSSSALGTLAARNPQVYLQFVQALMQVVQRGTVQQQEALLQEIATAATGAYSRSGLEAQA